MRLWPLPNNQGTISYRIDAQPAIYQLTDLQTHRAIPIPDQYMPLVCQLAQEALLSSPLWRKDCDKTAEVNSITNARNKLHNQIVLQSQSSVPPSCGTPWGF